VTPLAMTGCLLYSMATMVPPQYGSYVYPTWAIQFGWFVAVLSVIPIPVCAVIQLIKSYKLEKSFLKALLHSLHPGQSWGPKNKEHREYYQYEGIMSRFYQPREKDPASIRLRKV